MERLVKGDVVSIPFPFSDLSSTSLRPAFLITPLDGVDIIVCMITTQNRGKKYCVPITNTDFSSGGLPHDSYVRPDRIFTADSGMVKAVKGKLNQTKVQEIIQRIVEIMSQ